MNLDYVPLLQTQRDLYAIPRGFERFNEYIKTMVDPDSKDLRIPIGAMNPMGKDHVPALLDDYLAFGADEIGAETTAVAQTKLTPIPGSFKVTLVIADDAHGMWTNRTATDFSHRFQSKPMHRRGWFVGLIWTSETPSPHMVRSEIATTIFRGAHVEKHGYPETLAGMMAQEGYALTMADCDEPSLDSEEYEYSREIITPHLQSEAYPIQVACLYGDEAARELGYEPMGLTAQAGLALALHTAREKQKRHR